MPARRQHQHLHPCQPLTPRQQDTLWEYALPTLTHLCSDISRPAQLLEDGASLSHESERKALKIVAVVSASTINDLISQGTPYRAVRYPAGVEGIYMVPPRVPLYLSHKDRTFALVRMMRGVEWEQVADSRLCIRMAIPVEIVERGVMPGRREWTVESLDLHLTTPDSLALVRFTLSYSPLKILLGALIRLNHPHFFLGESALEMHHRPFGNRAEKIVLNLTTSPEKLCEWFGLSWDGWKSGIGSKRDLWEWLVGVAPGSRAVMGLAAFTALRWGDEKKRRMGKMTAAARDEVEAFKVYVEGRHPPIGGRVHGTAGPAVEGTHRGAHEGAELQKIGSSTRTETESEPARRLDEPRALDERESEALKFFGKEAESARLVQERRARLSGSKVA